MPMASLLPSPPLSLLSTRAPILSFPARKRHLLRLCPHAKNLDFGHWREEGTQILHRALESLPESVRHSVREFPWRRTFYLFAGTVLDIFLFVARCLSVPVLAVSSLSEMSYCAHERRMAFIPVPFVLGVGAAWVARRTAVDLAPELQEAKVPWHLVAMGMFFVLLKLLGPYFPYFGRIVIPHFANGGLWTLLWFVFQRQRVGHGEVDSRGD